jgi:hypothetical protein
METIMDGAEVWKGVDKWTKYVVSWLWWGMAMAWPVILVLLMLKGTTVGSYAADYVPVPTDNYLVWLYIAGIYWLVKGK